MHGEGVQDVDMESEEVQVVNGSEVVTELTDQLERFCHGRGDGW